MKPLARLLYAHVPGLAALRFAAKDLACSYRSKPEYDGLKTLRIGNGLIIDVGAHRGHSIAAFRRLAPRATIIAFEPDPQAKARLVARYRGDRLVSIRPIALGDRGGETTFYFPTYGRWDCDGMGATSEAEATEWLKDRGRMLAFNEKKLRVNKWTVPLKTLDSFHLTPSLIKLHAQGAEFDILKGSEHTITTCRPALMVAFPSAAVHELLTSWGYLPRRLTARSDTFTWYLTDQSQRICPDRPSR